MTLEDVMAYYGSGYKFSMITGMSHTNFLNWRKKGKIPVTAQVKIEHLTSGKLQADKGEWNECTQSN